MGEAGEVLLRGTSGEWTKEMAALSAGVLAVALLAVFFSSLPALASVFPTVLPLQRAFPLDRRIELDKLKARDRVRHGRFLQSMGGVVDFPVEGTYDPYLVG